MRGLGWIQSCIASVEQWSRANGADYQFVGDEVFTLLSDNFANKFAGCGPQLSDLARLKLVQQAFAAGYDYAVWADADLLIFDPVRLPMPTPDDSVFGVETWVDQAGSNRIRTWRNVHNAFMGFARDSVVLPYLIYSIESIASRIDPNSLAPQTFGPKLLTALNSITGFETTHQVGAFSEPVLANIADGSGAFLERLIQSQPESPAAANLCASLNVDEVVMSRVCEALKKKRAP